MTELVALMLSLATLFPPQLPSTQAADAVSWPIPGVERPGDGVTSPILLHETKPNYTGAAMRARVQGLVVMECVVELDGSVGPVRVTRSLDPTYGLDDAAVATIKQWRFRPGTKNGAPVRVAIIVEMSFTLGDKVNVRPPDPAFNPGTTAPISWPDTFTDSREVGVRSTVAWQDDSIRTPLFSIRFTYPSNWTVLKSAEADRLLTLYSESSLGTRTISISEPGPSPLVLDKPLQQSALDAFVLGASRASGLPPSLQYVKAGQVLRPGGLWLWFEMTASTVEPRSAPAAVADRVRTDYDGMHLWTFTTAVNGQSLGVFCAVLLHANSSEADKQQEIRRAGAEFGQILQRISIQPR
jgi:TonB family protein